MKRNKTRNSWQAAAGAVAILVASAAVAADKPARIDGGRVTRVAPEVATVGITHQQYFDRQRELQTWLVSEMPDGTLNSEIRVKLNAQDRKNLANPPAAPPLRIGVVKSIPRQPNGVTAKTSDGGFFWATTITSPDASGIRLHFSKFSMRVGAEVYVFNTEGEAHGPYTGQGRNGNGAFWSNTVFSDRAIVLVYQPAPANRANPKFVIDRVGHIGRRFPTPAPQSHNWSHDQCGNANCIEDANCGSAHQFECFPSVHAQTPRALRLLVLGDTGGASRREVQREGLRKPRSQFYSASFWAARYASNSAFVSGRRFSIILKRPFSLN